MAVEGRGRGVVGVCGGLGVLLGWGGWFGVGFGGWWGVIIGQKNVQFGQM